jgi:hypothetical protein
MRAERFQKGNIPSRFRTSRFRKNHQTHRLLLFLCLPSPTLFHHHRTEFTCAAKTRAAPPPQELTHHAPSCSYQRYSTATARSSPVPSPHPPPRGLCARAWRPQDSSSIKAASTPATPRSAYRYPERPEEEELVASSSSSDDERAESRDVDGEPMSSNCSSRTAVSGSIASAPPQNKKYTFIQSPNSKPIDEAKGRKRHEPISLYWMELLLFLLLEVSRWF